MKKKKRIHPKIYDVCIKKSKRDFVNVKTFVNYFGIKRQSFYIQRQHYDFEDIVIKKDNKLHVDKSFFVEMIKLRTKMFNKAAELAFEEENKSTAARELHKLFSWGTYVSWKAFVYNGVFAIGANTPMFLKTSPYVIGYLEYKGVDLETL